MLDFIFWNMKYVRKWRECDDCDSVEEAQELAWS